jgi:hypothetical protein
MKYRTRVVFASSLSAAVAGWGTPATLQAGTADPSRAALLTAVATEAPSDAGLAAPTAELRTRLNDLCWSMYRTYNDQTEEFYDAYREAYELLQVAKKAQAAAAAGGSPREIKESIAEISEEIHHIEHHLKEFAERPGIPDVAKKEVADRFEGVEATLGGLMTTLKVTPGAGHTHEGHEHEGHEHAEEADEAPAAVDPRQLAASAGQLRTRLNDFCTAMYQTYNNQSQEFRDVYGEAFGLLQAAKKVESQVRAGAPPQAVADALSQIDGEIHHVEVHLTEFAAARQTAAPAKDAVVQRFDAAETTLHDMLAQLGVRRKHLDAHAHDAEVAAEARDKTAAELAREMAIAATSLWRAMEHNYKENPDFEEAHGEALEFLRLCQNISSQVQGDQVAPEARGLISDLDGEIHHLEEHINGFKPDDQDQKAGVGRAKRKLEDVETLLHALMKRTGIEKKHVD